MIQKNPFTQFLIKGQKQDFFHSSAYGKAQSGNVIGVTSTESFSTRQKIEHNRHNIRSYRDSKIATETGNQGPRTKETEAEAIALAKVLADTTESADEKATKRAQFSAETAATSASQKTATSVSQKNSSGLSGSSAQQNGSSTSQKVSPGYQNGSFTSQNNATSQKSPFSTNSHNLHNPDSSTGKSYDRLTGRLQNSRPASSRAATPGPSSIRPQVKPNFLK